MKTVDKVLAWLIVAALVALVSVRVLKAKRPSTGKELPAIELSEVQEMFPEACRLQWADTSYYLVKDANDKTLGAAMLSAPYSDGVKGYAGRTPLLICLDKEGRIFNVRLLANNETPGFVNRLVKSGYFASWNGMSVDEALNADVDAVSGATYSSRGVQNSLKARLAVVSRQRVTPRDHVSQWGNVIIMVLVLMALACFFMPGKTKTLRLVVLLLSVVVIGFWQNALFSLVRLYGWLTSGISWQLEWAIILLFVLSLVMPLFTGKAFYCSYLCPMGGLQELAGKACKKKVTVSHKLTLALLLVRKLFLLTVLVLLLLGLSLNLACVEPFSVFSIRSLTVFSVAFAAVVLAVSLFVNRAWCRFLCPTGLLFDLVRRIGKA